MVCSVVTGWKKLSGDKNWEGLLQPLSPDLRRYLIHCAQSAGAVGDLFNGETHEPDATKQDFFSKAGLVKGNPYKYDVTHFLYAGCDQVEPSWFGYVAVATDEGKHVLGRRDILIAWRGTATWSEWLNDAHLLYKETLRTYSPLPENTRLPFTRVSTLSIPVPDRILLIPKLVPDSSLGAALAMLTAMDIVANGYNKPTQGNPVMVTAFTFGGPRVGNAGLADVFDTLGDHLHLLRIKNEKDFIPTLPPGIFSYAEFGIKLIVNSYKSEYLKWKGPFGYYAVLLDEHEHELNDIGSLDEVEPEYEPKRKRVRSELSSLYEDEYEPKRRRVGGALPQYYSCHNMDVYAHGVAIKDIDKNTPADKLDYDIALVNKYLDRVKNEYKIPPNWWVGDNRKKMFQLQNGRWVVV
ncbi:hypothetical protein F3Y22_tig00111779pilonHSYRG00200 [Hibiscus syriacus]|uniref:Phospholipase A1 n=1 Tax=Hibiscus syriacus TaxID=106335 RepID=A0A6A2XE74_HIBSY|nr:hypothetical protein F3Y22_tig00111779pilonHSYRG00200 [Hibiscus syriacus]